ncbi:uncharacterized protein FOMMEDRAFT_154220 [Fomitiporia mediterranea MF3/22]|uniref:uncharacterized protein n=1 Tax=Fomitiporia mediterranea (strain MF3/22) TaxID=694068 RepID=UPI0004409150|nr:uncharacterized protein FOMMEDRAFT_154220 [Fomitiporia mediterranea MF3/22]EJD05051.1 hypothetical protein FOMMEDRAFT_154220 [Fomitiporia mediterranea MF3/22]
MAKEMSENKTEKPTTEKTLEKRIEHIKNKRRDRGGIFQPQEHNPLIEMLMSRDVSGRSPSKARIKPRKSVVGKGSRRSSSREISPLEARAAYRRNSTAHQALPSVASKDRRKSTAPSSRTSREAAPEHANTISKTHGRAKPSSTSRTSSKRLEVSDASKNKSSVSSSKRRREETELETDEHDTGYDTPSPSKRLKKSAVPLPSASTTAKSATTSRSAPAKSKSKTATKEASHAERSDHDEDMDEPPPQKSKPNSTTKKRGRPKKIVDNSDVSEVPSTSKAKAKPKRAPASKPPSNKSGPTAKQGKTTAGKSRKKTISVDDDEPQGKTKGKGKKKAEPIPEPDIDSNSEEETDYRLKLPKSRLETVVEEDEEVEEESSGRNRKAITKGAATSGKGASTVSKPGASSASEVRRRKQHVEDDDIDERQSRDKIPTRAGKSKSQAPSRLKALTDVDKKDGIENENPISTSPPQNPKATSSRSKPNSAKATKTGSASGPASKSKPTSKSNTKRKRPGADPAPFPKSKFANLPTTVFNSPIKAAGNSDDELDFLS